MDSISNTYVHPHIKTKTDHFHAIHGHLVVHCIEEDISHGVK